jgi:hypothetical protein
LTLACDELGTPLVQKLDEASAESMWSDANINITQQRILRRHLRFHFGKRLFIPEKKNLHDEKYYQVPMSFGEYKYYKDDNRSQKPEKCPYWYRDAALVVTKELERLIDYTKDVDALNRFSSIAKEGMTIVAGADQGQGAWHSWLKISTMSGSETREQMGTDNTFDPKASYILSQVAHIACKKDNHKILAATVSDDLSAGYEKLQNSSLVIVRANKSDGQKEKQVQSYFLSKYAQDIKIEKDPLNDSTSVLTYTLQREDDTGFSTRYVDDEKLPQDASIIFIVPHFSIFITGDLSF